MRCISLKRSSSKISNATTKATAGKTQTLVDRVTSAIGNKDLAGATAALTALERLAQQDPHLKEFREKIAALTFPRDKEITVALGGGVALQLVRIPAGPFMMGDANGGTSEKPVHQVTITKPYYLGKYEVTQPQWQAVMGKNPSQFKGTDDPVENLRGLEGVRIVKEWRYKETRNHEENDQEVG